jgi:hypothetical protein
MLYPEQTLAELQSEVEKRFGIKGQYEFVDVVEDHRTSIKRSSIHLSPAEFDNDDLCIRAASLWLQKVIPACFLKEISPAYTLQVETDDEEKITMITCKEK